VEETNDGVEATIAFHGFDNGPVTRTTLKLLVEDRNSLVYHEYIASHIVDGFYEERSPKATDSVIVGLNGSSALSNNQAITAMLALVSGFCILFWN